MNLDEKPRPSVLDTLRASLPMKWIVALYSATSLIGSATVLFGTQIKAFCRYTLGFPRDVTEFTLLFIQYSALAATFFFMWLTMPHYIDKKLQKQRAREYSRQRKMAEQHQQIIERWKREVKPEGESQNT